MNLQSTNKSPLWLVAIRQKSVWICAAKIGLPVGCVQSLINQGDVWWQHLATGLTLAKTVVSPLVTFGVALVSAMVTWIERQRREDTPDLRLPSRSTGGHTFTHGGGLASDSSASKHEIVQM